MCCHQVSTASGFLTEKRKVAGLSGSEILTWKTHLDAGTLFMFVSLTQNSFWWLVLHVCLWLQGLEIEIVKMVRKTQGADMGPGKGRHIAKVVNSVEG